MQRFWNKVNKGTDCWEWVACRVTDGGYGRFNYNGKPDWAHRVSWLLSIGDIPSGMCVLHKCDNPPCVNPDHLFLGTKEDNAHDRIAKGRYTVHHGTRAMYVDKKCRCGLCKKANTDYHRKRRLQGVLA